MKLKLSNVITFISLSIFFMASTSIRPDNTSVLRARLNKLFEKPIKLMLVSDINTITTALPQLPVHIQAYYRNIMDELINQEYNRQFEQLATIKKESNITQQIQAATAALAAAAPLVTFVNTLGTPNDKATLQSTIIQPLEALRDQKTTPNNGPVLIKEPEKPSAPRTEPEVISSSTPPSKTPEALLIEGIDTYNCQKMTQAINAGAIANKVVGHNNKNVLHSASVMGCIDLIKTLIESGKMTAAEYNAQDFHGYTPLDYARYGAQYGHRPVNEAHRATQKVLPMLKEQAEKAEAYLVGKGAMRKSEIEAAAKNPTK